MLARSGLFMVFRGLNFPWGSQLVLKTLRALVWVAGFLAASYCINALCCRLPLAGAGVRAAVGAARAWLHV